jgi:uncharacterized protein DUF3987
MVDKNLFKETPLILKEVYEVLPSFLAEPLSIFDEGRERDIFLISLLASLSATIPSVSGKYRKEVCHANINSFVVAPPASGKGSMNLTLKSHAKLQNAYDIKIPHPTNPEIAVKRSIIIPGNTSSTAFINQLFINKGTGILFESEADTLNYSLKQDWGSYSDMIRKGFHNEAISINRVGAEVKEIKSPKFSVVLSGTPDQVKSLIPSAENGLLSRLLFYTFVSDVTWQDATPSMTNQSESSLIGLSNNILDLYQYFENNSCFIGLQQNQWDDLNTYFDEALQNIVEEGFEDASSLVFRHGLMTYKISMLLTAIRVFESKTEISSTGFLATDVDFYNALSITSTLLQHAFLIYKSLPNSESSGRSSKMLQFLNLIPEDTELTKNDMVDYGSVISWSSRTVANKLISLVESEDLIKLKHGLYFKPHK